MIMIFGTLVLIDNISRYFFHFFGIFIFELLRGKRARVFLLFGINITERRSPTNEIA